MQTELADFLAGTADGEEAKTIIGKCVHCGFCTATCPTYQLLGDELDGPRGRIYLMKNMFEGEPVTRKTQLHLDRCLSCRNCETTCPSGVQYGRLIDIGRRVVETRVERPAGQRLMRYALTSVVPRRGLFSTAMAIGRVTRPLLNAKLKEKIPQGQLPRATPDRQHVRRMLLLEGCVQPAMLPNVNIATRRVFDALGVQVISAHGAGCCGAIRLHLAQTEDGLADVRRNIDAWWPHVEDGVEVIIMNASACGATVKEYGHLLRNDAKYAIKAARISALAKDLAEILPNFVEELVSMVGNKRTSRVAFHPPCTLQHGQKIKGAIEGLLGSIGVDVRLAADSHLCCGSAGTYSITQPELAGALRSNKLTALERTAPDMIVSANIGCITHLGAATGIPVRHWIELLDDLISAQPAP